MELPIAGNTQLDPNSTNPLVDIENRITLNVQNKGAVYQLTDPQKVNEYLSWYLNGTIYRAEWPFPVDPLSVYNNPQQYHQAMMQITDYSGPLRKLLPWRVQLGRQNEMGSDNRTHNDERLGLIERANWENHNQGVVCYTMEMVRSPSGLIGARQIPYPCYSGEQPNQLSEGSSYMRLLDLGGQGQPGNPPPSNEPPLEENYFTRRFIEYWQDYLGWRGSNCIQVWLFGSWRLLCLHNNLSSPIGAFYNYIPFSSTEDVRGEIVFNLSQTPQPAIDGVEVLNASYTPAVADNNANGVLDTESDYHVLYYPHLYELAELSALLQETHLTQEHSGLSGLYTKNEFYNTYRCDLGNARWNSGDDLFGEYQENYPWASVDANRDGYDDWDDEEIEGTIKFDVTFSCDFPPPGEPDPTCLTEEHSRCLASCDPAPSTADPVPEYYPTCTQYCDSVAQAACAEAEPVCRKNAYPAISSYTRMPFVDDIWDRLVAGKQSVYKRFYPRDLFDNPGVAEILDLPTVTTAHYSHRSQNPLVVESTTFAGEPLGGRPGERANIYFPHFGGLYEYFLKGIQKALRPQDYATFPTSGIPSTPGTGQQCTSLPASEEIDYRNTFVQPRQAQDLYNRVVNRFPGNQILRTPAQNNEIVPDWLRNQGFDENDTYYNIVVGTSRNFGYNPAFVLAIWLAETGASDYQLFPYGLIDFGCGSQGSTPEAVRLLSNLRCFLDLYLDWSAGGVYDSLVGSCREGGEHPNYEDFLLFFATGICSTVTANNRQFCTPHADYHTKIWNWYQFVIGLSDTHP